VGPGINAGECKLINYAINPLICNAGSSWKLNNKPVLAAENLSYATNRLYKQPTLNAWENIGLEGFNTYPCPASIPPSTTFQVNSSRKTAFEYDKSELTGATV
jgi:hypothetical protein